MIRKSHKKPGAIFCSDLHLRETQPICRLDNVWNAQWKKVDHIRELSETYSVIDLQTEEQNPCPVLHAGDLFDYWKPSPWLLTNTILHLPRDFRTVYGQHDLPQHNLKLANKCGINTLKQAGRLQILNGCHWGQLPSKDSFSYIDHSSQRKVLIWHHLTYRTKPFPGATGGMAMGILKKYPQYDIILTGDNHQSFAVEYKGRWLINPGSMLRMDADQEDHLPCVYLWYPKDNTIAKHLLPIEPNVISREHIEQKERRDNRINAFISKLNNDEWKAELSFEDNLRTFETINKPSKRTMEIIYKSLEK